MKKISVIFALTTLLALATTAFADLPAKGKILYKEMEFVQLFKGKSQKFVLETLGQPIRKQLPNKPTNAESYVGKVVANNDKQGDEKQDVIEMWYYPNLVMYNSKNTFKKTELTFINDKCTNLTFVN